LVVIAITKLPIAIFCAFVSSAQLALGGSGTLAAVALMRFRR